MGSAEYILKRLHIQPYDLILYETFVLLRVLPLGMDTLNSALETALTSKDKADWSPVTVNVASATLTVLVSDVSVVTAI